MLLLLGISVVFWLSFNAAYILVYFILPSFTGLTIKCPFIRVNGGYSTTSGVYTKGYVVDEPDNPVWKHSEGNDRYIFKLNWIWRIGTNASLSTGNYFYKSKMFF